MNLRKIGLKSHSVVASHRYSYKCRAFYQGLSFRNISRTSYPRDIIRKNFSIPGKYMDINVSNTRNFIHAEAQSQKDSVSDLRSARQKLLLIEACLRTRQFKRAEILFDSLSAGLSKENKKDICSVHVYNLFIKSILDDSAKIGQGELRSSSESYRFRDALSWFGRMKSSDISPNLTTYALLMHGAWKYRNSQPQAALTHNPSIDFLKILIADFKTFAKRQGYLSDESSANLKNIVDELITLAQMRLDKSYGCKTGDSITGSQSMDLFQLDLYREFAIKLPNIENPIKTHKLESSNLKENLIASNLPEIRPTKTHNLSYVKQSLNPLMSDSRDQIISSSVNSDLSTDFNIKESPEYQKQIFIEQESFRINLEQVLHLSEKKKEVTGIGLLPVRLKQLSSLWWEDLKNVISGELMIKCKDIIGGINTQDLTMRETSNFLNWSVLDMSENHSDFASLVLTFDKCPEKLAIATMSQFIKAYSESSGEAVRASNLVYCIGESVEQEYRMLQMKNSKIRQKMASDYLKQQSLLRSKKLFEKTVRSLNAKKLDSEGDYALSLSSSGWDQETKMKIGSILASAMIQSSKVPVLKEIPTELAISSNLQNFNLSILKSHPEKFDWVRAFKHDYIQQAGKMIGVVEIQEAVAKAFEESVVNVSNKGMVSQGILLPRLLPMLVPPKPWIDYQSGGYLTVKTHCMRGVTKEAEDFLKKGSLSGQLNMVFSGLDVLGSTKWRVNEDVLKHMIYAWNTGKSIGKLPAEVPQAPIEPKKPENFDEVPAVRAKWYNEKKRLKQEYSDMKSQRATENYKLEIARAFVGKSIYFPHSLDFRGRAYPIPQLFSHIGNDVARSLLIFDQAKPLGKNGLRWLKIHLANSYGNDKCTFDEREKFVDDNIECVFASASNPFGPNPELNGWWLKGDKPWMTLSAAIEVFNAMKSDEPEKFLSRLPVHQDGSCNGLQHYAALGGDRTGAEQVNLVKSKNSSKGPSDVYSAAADIVKDLVQKDIDFGNKRIFPDEEIPNTINKEILDDPLVRYKLAKKIGPENIDRKIVKQSVMTSVYGVTFVGARDQIRNRIKEKFYPEKFTADECYVLAHYITPKVFEALNNMFTGARHIQDWLAESARLISSSIPETSLEHRHRIIEKMRADIKKRKISGSKTKNMANMEKYVLVNNNSVIWTTPLGLTVAQPYRKTKNQVVTTALQTFSVKQPSTDSPVDTLKQVAGFPPNFIHSLDATHMLMTALECAKEEDPIEFASVHDSYWTHACDIERLRDILKKKFVELHSKPILENLREEMTERYSGMKVLKAYTREDFLKRCSEINSNTLGLKYKFDGKRKRFIVDESHDISGGELNRNEISNPTGIIDSIEGTVSELSGIDGAYNNSHLSNSEAQLHDYSHSDFKFKANQKLVHVWEDMKLPPVPEKGNFDIKEVLDSEYFFS